jgi:hypothetical protein
VRLAWGAGGGGGGDGGQLGARAVVPGGGGGGGDSGMWAFSACGHFEMRQRREEKMERGWFQSPSIFID